MMLILDVESPNWGERIARVRWGEWIYGKNTGLDGGGRC